MRLSSYQKSDPVRVEGSQQTAGVRAMAWLRTLPDQELRDAYDQASPAARQRGKLLLGGTVTELPNMQELAIAALCLRCIEVKCALRLCKPPAPATIRKRPDPSAMRAQLCGASNITPEDSDSSRAIAEAPCAVFVQAASEEAAFDQ
jgi:hypothetical protein